MQWLSCQVWAKCPLLCPGGQTTGRRMASGPSSSHSRRSHQARAVHTAGEPQVQQRGLCRSRLIVGWPPEEAPCRPSGSSPGGVRMASGAPTVPTRRESSASCPSPNGSSPGSQESEWPVLSEFGPRVGKKAGEVESKCSVKNKETSEKLSPCSSGLKHFVFLKTWKMFFYSDLQMSLFLCASNL